MNNEPTTAPALTAEEYQAAVDELKTIGKRAIELSEQLGGAVLFLAQHPEHDGTQINCLSAVFGNGKSLAELLANLCEEDNTFAKILESAIFLNTIFHSGNN